jgi:lysophospholipase L1-like esterase
MALALGAGCREKGGPPAPSPVSNIELSCPANIRFENVVGAALPVTYGLPAVTGGIPPITPTCSPASGSPFPLGSTNVVCNATDGVRPATCQFTVTLVPFVPELAVTKFLAFGDSITAGELQPNPPSQLAIEIDKAYPTVLRNLLIARYAKQSFVVDNRGVPGESAEEGSRRIGGVLDQVRPEALLLLQGVIDMGGGLTFVPVVRDALRSDIIQARNRGIANDRIFLSTLLPQKRREEGFPARNFAEPFLDEINFEIRALAVREGVNLVDAFAVMAPDAKNLIGGDGLHPSEQGFIVLAQTFFDVIKQKLELPPPTGPTPGSRPAKRR